jgi:hypothetical protein
MLKWFLAGLGTLSLALLAATLVITIDTLLWSRAHAVTTPTYIITWSAPTRYTDQTTIAGAITYQLYVGASGQEMRYKTPVTAPPYVLVPTPGPGQTCVQVTSTVNGVESIRSPEVCATVPLPPPIIPNPPSNVTATVK